MGKQGFGQNCKEYEFINKELERFAFNQENCYFVTAKGLTSNPDGIHIDAISQRKFGIRYFQAFSKQEHVLTPLIHEEKLVGQLAARKNTKTEKIYIKTLDFSLGKISYDDYLSAVMKINSEE